MVAGHRYMVSNRGIEVGNGFGTERTNQSVVTDRAGRGIFLYTEIRNQVHSLNTYKSDVIDT